VDETEPGPPKLLERGRYAVYEAPDGGWVLARALDVCDDCRSHGCGEQAEPIVIPAMVIKVASMRDAGFTRKLRAMMTAGKITGDAIADLEPAAADYDIGEGAGL
jgi:hypothetical protein